MALLIVQAASEDTIAAPGNRNPNYIVVSVTDSNGNAVQGLTNTNFKVDPMIVGPGGSLVEITSVSAGRLAGFYFVNVVPSRRRPGGPAATSSPSSWRPTATAVRRSARCSSIDRPCAAAG
jgi:hypothetical protein